MVAGEDVLDVLLDGNVKGGANGPASRVFCETLHVVESVLRQSLGLVRQGLGYGSCPCQGVHGMVLEEIGQEGVPFVQEFPSVLARVDVGGSVWKYGQGCGLSPGEGLRGGAEVSPGGGVYPDDVPPERGVGCVQAQDPLLGTAGLQAKCHESLQYLLFHGPGLPFTKNADHLHRERASAACDPPRLDVPGKGPHDREGINAWMDVEVLVLEAEQGLLILHWQGVPLGESPLSVLGYPRSQELSAAVFDYGTVRCVGE